MNTDSDVFAAAITRCYFCLEPSDIVVNRVLLKTSANKVKKMDGKVVSTDPCQKCQDFMKMGIIVIVVDDERSKGCWDDPIPNPYRTGGWYVLRDAAIRRIFEGSPTLDKVLNARFTFMSSELATAIGLNPYGK